MPRRNDLHRILVIGSGPIVIGQGAEFDYSGTQAAKALKEEGYSVILVNSNPATIMTDPEFADRTYLEPVTPEFVELVIEKEKPDALLPTMGGPDGAQRGDGAHDDGFSRSTESLDSAPTRARSDGEDRGEFARGDAAHRLAVPWAESPRPSMKRSKSWISSASRRSSGRFHPGWNRRRHRLQSRRVRGDGPAGARAVAVSQVLVERSVIGWKEFELEVMRDCADNVVIVCSIENLDPMGVHTGDSITVAPAMTLTDREYQKMRDAAVAVIREIGVEAGGCNIQFAVNPENGEMLVIEMNPRVSRSSALASKATGFPIARIGTKLAVGYRLDEIPNDITKTTPASFEPVLDYVVVKCPRFAFEKFTAANPQLTTQMKSVGESMAIGRTFKEALQKGLRALETGRPGWAAAPRLSDDRLSDDSLESLRGALRQPTPERIFQIKRALEAGVSITELNELTHIDPWFLAQMHELVEAEADYAELDEPGADDVRSMKRMGFSDRQLASLRGST
jgi:carbamoyl-phosphate synthase large subunit